MNRHHIADSIAASFAERRGRSKCNDLMCTKLLPGMFWHGSMVPSQILAVAELVGIRMSSIDVYTCKISAFPIAVV